MANEGCKECKVPRIPKRGIKVTNCINSKNYWFCGFPCLLDYFGKIESGQVSQITQIMNRFGIETSKTLKDGLNGP